MLKWIVIVALLGVAHSVAWAEELELFILAGQSNAQGWAGNGASYPADPDNADKNIPFYWETPKHSSSNGTWTHLQAQGGRFPKGHFGPEIAFARNLRKAGYKPALFKYTLGGTSLAADWGEPGGKGMYGRMVEELKKAIGLLEKEGHTVTPRGFVWIQGESDGSSDTMATGYEARLKRLIDDLRGNVLQSPDLPVLLGVDEQHPLMKQRPIVVETHKKIAHDVPFVAFTSMIGLPKADTSHLTPEGLEEHGKRIFDAFVKIEKKRMKSKPSTK
ncbi:MAG: hypothetical protein A2Z34_09830 [Planctomycetes bacterium RBG_16_59_8]|nr:MAG: hypothetical protein A2Z34_09830 [Planctomycetes bacterium RBG_16_59_8]